jgi:hypothetical protein
MLQQTCSRCSDKTVAGLLLHTVHEQQGIEAHQDGTWTRSLQPLLLLLLLLQAC